MKAPFRPLLPCIACFLFLLSSCNRSPYADDPELQQAIEELDLVFKMEEEITAGKLARIDSLRLLSAASDRLPDRYQCYSKLFDEFLKWDADSALLYAHRKEELARESGDPALINDAVITLANRYLISGMFQDVIALMGRIDQEVAARTGQIKECYSLLYEAYHRQIQVTCDEKINREYRIQEAKYLELCKNNLTGESHTDSPLQSNILIREGKTEEARRILEEKIERGTSGYYNLSLLYYWVARTYQAEGDSRNTLLNLVRSARYDYLTPIRDYASPNHLTRMFYERGDIDRAYQYVTRSYTDAGKVGSRLRQSQMASLLPTIVQAYERQEQQRAAQLRLLVFGLLATLLGMSFMMTLLRRNHRRLHRALLENRRKTRALDESNQIKDAYIVEFLTMFSEHVSALERYRSKLRNTAKGMDLNNILAELRSDRYIDAEWDYLYRKFDQTFLGLFPDFKEKLNALLKEDAHIGEKLPSGQLSNELRIFALVRLGVNEPARIAAFLRKSPTTIYNYRVKLRNAARDREHFEEQLRRL